MCGYVDRFFYITQSLWAILGIVIMAFALVVLGMLVVSRSGREASRGAAEAAVGIVAIQAALWIALICIFALPLLRQATLQRISVCSLDNLFFFFAGAAAWSFGVGLVAFAIYASRWLLARAPFLTLERKAQLTPRMLFGGPIIFAIIVGVGVNVVIFFGPVTSTSSAGPICCSRGAERHVLFFGQGGLVAGRGHKPPSEDLCGNVGAGCRCRRADGRRFLRRPSISRAISSTTSTIPGSAIRTIFFPGADDVA